MADALCAKGCGRLRRDHHSYCLECQLAYQREWRATTKVNRSQKRKQKVRGKTNRAIRNGLLEPQPCKCGVLRSFVEAHHPDYNNHLLVEWLCRKCHHALHKRERSHVGERYRKNPPKIVRGEDRAAGGGAEVSS